MKCPECPFCPDIMIIEEQGFLVNTVHSLRSMACFETCNLQLAIFSYRFVISPPRQRHCRRSNVFAIKEIYKSNKD